MVGHNQGLGSKLRGESQGMDKHAKRGEEDIGGVEGMVRCKSLILRGLEHQSEGRGGYGGWCHWWWRGERRKSGL